MATQGRGEAGAGGRRKGSIRGGLQGSGPLRPLRHVGAPAGHTELGKGPQSLPLLSIGLDPLASSSLAALGALARDPGGEC